MGMKALEDIREMLCKELDKFAERRELSAASLETLHKLTDTIKNIDKIEMLEEDGGGYSRDGNWTATGTYGRGYSRDMLMDDGRGGYSNRHYVRGHYSRDGGYSRDEAKDMVMKELGEAISHAETTHEKEIIREAIRNIEKL